MAPRLALVALLPAALALRTAAPVALDRRAVLTTGAAASLLTALPPPALAVNPPPDWVTAVIPPCIAGQNGACVAPAKFDDAFFRDFKDAAGGSGLKFKIYQESELLGERL